MLPSFRTINYAIWSACERFNILPPDIKGTWEDTNMWGKAQLIAYNQIRIMEEVKEKAALAGIKI